MYTICPKCKSKNIKTIETQVECIKSECLNCGHIFERQPTVEERDNFN
jgi:Zn ribbon nucleic-acid-binding protein